MIAGLVALVVALTGAVWIDVPFVRQARDGCGSASVWMLLEYWGKGIESVEDIHRKLFSSDAEGVYAADMQRYFESRQFQVTTFTGEWSDLVDNIGKGRPLIVCIGLNSRGNPLHYVVVAGVDEAGQAVLVNDPAGRKLLPLSRAEFERGWAAMDRWTLLALPAEPGATAAAAEERKSVEPAEPFSPALAAAGDAFRSRDFRTVKRLAGRAAGESPLANELLAATYFLEDNLEAALEYWNRNQAPHIRDVRFDLETRWDPIQLDRTIGISRESTLGLGDYVAARKRLDAAGVVKPFVFDLVPAQDDDFDLVLRGTDRSGWNWLSWLRGLPYLTVSPGYTNIAGRAIHVQSLMRWDKDKRRADAEVSWPASARSRYVVSADARHEIWDLGGRTTRIRKQEISAGIRSIVSPRLSWSSEGIVTHRPDGSSLRYGASLSYDAVRIPQKRFTLTPEIRSQFGRYLSGGGRIARAEGVVALQWMPQAAGDDYRISTTARASRIWGRTFEDEMFALGLGRDEELPLRAHPATRDGRKGAAVIGRRYGLLNAQMSKRLFDVGWVGMSVVPFIDLARAHSVFVDAGAELRLSVASMATVSFSVGRDLRTGKTSAFFNTLR